MKNNINKKVGATLLAAAIMAGTAVIPMSNAAVEAAATKAAKATTKPSIEYRVQVQDRAWMPWVSEGEMAGTVGESRRMETLQVRMINCEGVSLKFYAHIQDLGDCYFTDKDEYVGTVAQSKRVEAIAITSEGLKEKGYKLQYRVQVQDKGWMPWVDDGEMAGTRYESKRLETIEIVVVPVDDELAVEKAVAVDTLTDYEAALSTVPAISADYTKISPKIEEAISEIEEATTKTQIDAKFDEIVKQIKKIYPEIEKLAEENNKKTAEERVKAMDEVSAYEEAVAQAKLLDSERRSISTIITNATKAINNAKTPTNVQNALGNLNTLMSGYVDVATIKAQNAAIKELNTYLGKVRPGTIKTINETIETIKKDKNPVTIASAVDNIKSLVIAQDEAYANLKAYKDTLPTIDNSIISSTNKSIILLEISKVEEQVENAKKATDGASDNAILDDVQDIMNEFTTNYVANYQALETATQNALLKNATDSAIKTLEEYLTGYEEYHITTAPSYSAARDVQKIAEDAIKELKDGVKADGTALNTAALVKTALGQFNTDTTGVVANDNRSGYLGSIETAIDAIEANKDTIKANYITAYNNAMKELEGYYNYVSGTDLTNAQKQEVYSMIDNTKVTISTVTTDGAVQNAMNAFKAYISKYYEEAMIDKVKESAKEELKAYKDSTVTGVATAAQNGINAIDALTDKNGSTSTTTDDYTIANIDTALNNARTAIQNAIDVNNIAVAKSNAMSNIMTYQEEAKRLGVTLSSGAADKTVEMINAQMAKLATTDDTYKDMLTAATPKTASEIIELINSDTKDVIDSIKKDMSITDDLIVAAQNRAIEDVDEYARLARLAGYTNLPSELETLKGSIREARTTTAIADAKGDIEEYIERHYDLFYYQLTKINTVKAWKPTVADINSNPDKNNIVKIVDKAVEDITKLTDKNDDKVIDKNDVDVIVGKATADKAYVDAQIAALATYKGNLKAEIGKMKAKSTVASKTQYETYYNSQIDALRISDCKWTGTVADSNVTPNATIPTAAVKTILDNAKAMFDVKDNADKTDYEPNTPVVPGP